MAVLGTDARFRFYLVGTTSSRQSRIKQRRIMGVLTIPPFFIGLVFSVAVVFWRVPFEFRKDAWWEWLLNHLLVSVLTLWFILELSEPDYAIGLSKTKLLEACVAAFCLTALPGICKLSNVIRRWIKAKAMS